MDAGRLIRERRDAAKLTQDDVAAQVGVSPGAVSQWETGRAHPRRATAIRLEQLFKANGSILDALGYVADPSVTPRRRRRRAPEIVITNYDVLLEQAFRRIDTLESEVERLSQLAEASIAAMDADDEQAPDETGAARG